MPYKNVSIRNISLNDEIASGMNDQTDEPLAWIELGVMRIAVDDPEWCREAAREFMHIARQLGQARDIRDRQIEAAARTEEPS